MDKTLITSVRLPEEDYLFLKKYCEDTGRQQTWVMQKAIKMFRESFKKYDKDFKP